MIVALLALAMAQADPQAETGEASVALATCTIPHVQAGAAGSETAEAIADAAIDACAEPQARLRSIFVRRVGEARADAGMQIVIAGLRDRLIHAVNERRGLVSRRDNEATAWGDCIRARATALASRSDPVETLADEAMRQCATEEASLREGLTQRRGAAAVDQFMPAIIAETRNMAMQAVRQARAVRADDQ